MASEPAETQQDLEKSLQDFFARRALTAKPPENVASADAVLLGAWAIHMIVDGTAFEVVRWLGKTGFKELSTLIGERDQTVIELTVTDPEGTSLSLKSGIPDEAIEAFKDVDWSAVKGGDIVWNENRKLWEHRERLRLLGKHG